MIVKGFRLNMFLFILTYNNIDGIWFGFSNRFGGRCLIHLSWVSDVE